MGTATIGNIPCNLPSPVRAVRAYVRSYLAGRLAEARRELGAYADRYRACMQEALDVARSGAASGGAWKAYQGARNAYPWGAVDLFLHLDPA